jgi:hypothetical protein
MPSSSGTHGSMIHSSSSGCLSSHGHQAAAAGSSSSGLGCGSGAGSSGYVTGTGSSSVADGTADFAAASGAVGGGCCSSVLQAGMVELPVLVSAGLLLLHTLLLWQGLRKTLLRLNLLLSCRAGLHQMCLALLNQPDSGRHVGPRAHNPSEAITTMLFASCDCCQHCYHTSLTTPSCPCPAPQVDHHKEVEAWKVALCLMHPLDPTCGRSPSSLLTTCTIRPLVSLADKYNLAVRGSGGCWGRVSHVQRCCATS